MAVQWSGILSTVSGKTRGDKNMSQPPSRHPSPNSGGGSHLVSIALPPLLLSRNITLLLYSCVQPGTTITKQCLATCKWGSIYEHANSSPLATLPREMGCFWTYLIWSEMDLKTTHDSFNFFPHRLCTISRLLGSHDPSLLYAVFTVDKAVLSTH